VPVKLMRSGVSERRTGGPAGNERLTAATGAVLLVLLAVEGVTILSVRQLFFWHAFVGMLLVGPLLVKLGSTMYRFGRYYTGSATYRRKGPPRPVLRAAGPVVVASSLAVFGTGVALLLVRPGHGGALVMLHKAAFVVWIAVMVVHVLGYVLRVPAQVRADWGPAAFRRRGTPATGPGPLPGAGLRRWVLAAGLAAGLVLALGTSGLAHAWAHWLAVGPKG
jgi:hypothetical protein